MNRLVAIGWITLAGACGYTDAGSGTGTLLVDARAVYRAAHDNQTSIDVEVAKNGEDFVNARVTVKDGDGGGTITLTERGGGRYSDDLSGYHRKLELTVELGGDNLNVRLEGPGPHVLTDPLAGDRISLGGLGGALPVRWRVADGLRADEASISLNQSPYESGPRNDDGSWEIPVTSLASGTEEVRVERTNRIAPNGGVAGSSFEMTYDVRVAFDIDN